MEVSGAPFDRGFASGALFKVALQRRVERNRAALNDASIQARAREVIKKTEAVFPDYVAEVRGKAAGAGLDEPALSLLMCPELVENFSACTSLVFTKGDGNIILSHNEDDDFQDDNLAMTKMRMPDGSWFASNDMDKYILGHGFSWNSHGIVKTVNYVRPIHETLDNISRIFLQRYITEASSIEDAIERCQITQCATGFHALVLDTITKKAVSIEVADSSVDIQDVDMYAHSNHYCHESITHGNEVADSGYNSPFRLSKTWELVRQLGSSASGDDARAVLEYRGKDFDNSILVMKDEVKTDISWYTLVNFTIDTTDRKIHLRFRVDKTDDYVFAYDAFPKNI